MRTLVLLTSNYPFGTGEPFLETEITYLSREFDRVIIIAQNTSSLSQRQIPENTIAIRYNPSTSISGFLFMPLLIIKNFKLIISLIDDEKKFRHEIGRSLKLNQIRPLIKRILKTIQLRNFIIKSLNRLNISSDIIFYSYWLKTGAHAIALAGYKSSIRISRAHRIDLYEEETRDRYLPLVGPTFRSLDCLFFISDQGKNYFSERFRLNSTRMDISYLGVNIPSEIRHRNITDESFTILSCSNLIKVKRVDLIIEALQQLVTEKKIRWVHFGTGTLMESLSQLASARLGDNKNISYVFMGHKPNKEILDFYKANTVDLFLNASSSEGLPVSIMEAMSHGIPVIATDSGGVKEIVVPGTGFLLPVDFRPEQLAQKISEFINLKTGEQNQFRDNAYLNCKNKFDSEINYRSFIKKVSIIFESIHNNDKN